MASTPITKIWPVTWCDAGHAIRYVENHKKTEVPEADVEQITVSKLLGYTENREKTWNKYFIYGVNVNPDNAVREFDKIKSLYGKKDGVQAWHAVQSFPADANLSPQEAHEIGIEFAKKMWGSNYQVVVSTHLNTGHIHNHFVVNSVGLDGMKIHDELKAWTQLKKVSDEICKEHDIQVIDNPTRKGRGNYYLHSAEKNHEPTRYDLIKDLLDDGIEHSRSVAELEAYLKANHCTCNFDPKHKYWTVKPYGYERGVRTFRLGEDYSKDRIQERLEEEKLNDREGLPTMETDTPDYMAFVLWQQPQMLKVRTRYYQNVGHFSALYSYWGAMLGLHPKTWQPRVPAIRLPYRTRTELIHYEKYAAEQKFLNYNNIETMTELHTWWKDSDNNLDDLEQMRNSMRRMVKNTRQNGGSPEQMKKYQDEVNRITKQISSLRQDRKICNQILFDAPDIKDRLEQTDREMQSREKDLTKSMSASAEFKSQPEEPTQTIIPPIRRRGDDSDSRTANQSDVEHDYSSW